jgi:hypothetical protein
MNTQLNITNIVISLASLAFLWINLCWLYRSYRLDLFRQRMFAVRDRLFDMGISGEIAFDDPAYGMLRSTINGIIHNGHRCGLMDIFILFALCAFDKGFEASSAQHEKDWEAALSKLPIETRQKLTEIRNQALLWVFDQIVFTSVLLLVTMIAFIAAVAAKFLSVAIIKKVTNSGPFQWLASKIDFASNALVTAG